MPLQAADAWSVSRRRSVLVQNRQREQRINTRLLRRMVRMLVDEFLGIPSFDLSIQIVGRAEIVRLNETFLRHSGQTDVIAFDYRDDAAMAGVVYGEVFVCLPVALEQSRRFRTNWERELVRYAVHGVLHLAGYDDRDTETRQFMKRTEDKALKLLCTRFFVGKLGGHLPLTRKPGRILSYPGKSLVKAGTALEGRGFHRA